MKANRYSAFAPIGLRLSGDGSRRIVRNLTEAAELLIRDWPADDGEEYIVAVKACVDAIRGDVTPEDFRQALLRAASEAGIAAFSAVQAVQRHSYHGAPSYPAAAVGAANEPHPQPQ